MTEVVKTRNQACPAGKRFFPFSTNIPFLESNPDAFSTRFKEDFRPVFAKNAEPVSQPSPAQVDHKDLRYIKEYMTEVTASYKHHPLPQMTRIPGWTKLNTNFKMQTDPGGDGFLTTHCEKFPLQPFQPPPTPIRQPLGIKRIKQVEKLPESTSQVSYIPHQGSAVIKAKVKHLEKGFPSITGDGRRHILVSEHNNAFQGAWGRAAQRVKKHTSSVAMGDPVKIIKRETTQAASFSWPPVCRSAGPPVVKEIKKNLNLGNSSSDSWLCTTREAFCYKQGDPVVLIKRNKNFSSLPEGDIDARRNRERMTVTTNRIFFPESNHTEPPVYVCTSDLMTKSHVQFGSPRLLDLYYSTSSKEHYGKPDGERARPATQLPSNILTGPEHGPSQSTSKTDYIPLKTCRPTACRLLQQSNTRFSLAHQHFSTTHSEEYTAKPLIVQRPSCNHFLSHFVLQ